MGGTQYLFNAKKWGIVFISVFLIAICAITSSSCLDFSDLYLDVKESTVLEFVTTIAFEDNYAVDLLVVDEERNRVYVNAYFSEPYAWARTYIVDCESNNKIPSGIPLGDVFGFGELYQEFIPDEECVWINPGMNRLIMPHSSDVHVYDLGSNDELFRVEDLDTNWIERSQVDYNPTTNLFYVGYRTIWEETYDRVMVIDGETFELISEVYIPESYEPLTKQHVGVAVNSKKNWIYATWTGYDGRIFLIDGATHEIIKSREETSINKYTELQVNPYTNYVYLDNKWDTTVLDGETLERVYTWNEFEEGNLMAVDSINNLLYTRKDNILYVLNGTTHEKLTSLNLGTEKDIYKVAINSKTGKIYIDVQEPDIKVYQLSTKLIEEPINEDQENKLLFGILITVGVVIIVLMGFWFALFRKRDSN
jgi:hypothetical protein